MSKKELDRLGDRLRDSAVPSVEDLQLLETVRPHYTAALDTVCRALTDVGLDKTFRQKNRETIVDKLRRETDMLEPVGHRRGPRRPRDEPCGQDDVVAAIAAKFTEVGSATGVACRPSATGRYIVKK